MSLKVYDLTVNYLKNPCGIDTTPRFSYKVASDKQGDAQKKRRICVYSSEALLEAGQPDMWDSGYVESDNTVLIHYEGKKLAPVTKYYFSCEVESINGETACSKEGTFVTGKLDEAWQGKWIIINRPDRYFKGAYYFRHEFEAAKEVQSAYLTICGLGYFESYINGERTGDDILSPGFTAYDKDVLYMQYDVAGLLKQGKNAIGVNVGNGFYYHFSEDNWGTYDATWRNFPKMICELKITYADGTVEKVVSGSNWKVTIDGPIIFTGIRNGEQYDANKELGDWANVGYDDSAWQTTKVWKSPGGVMRAQEMEPIRVYKKFPAVKKWQSKNGGWIFDIGQNLAGYGEYVLHGPAGTEVTFRYSDVLDKENEIVMLGHFVRTDGFQTDKYIKKSDAPETWHARFCYHGFQYIEVTGLDYEPELSDIVGVAICTEVGDIGEFKCSNDNMNRLQHLCRWASISNMESFPTDNPHREKNGWTGDTMLSCEQMLTNFGSRAFFTKWSWDMRSSQRPAGQIPCIVPSPGWGYSGLMGPDWSAALVNIPWYVYLYNNDLDILKANYEAIKKNIEFMLTMTEDYTLCYGTGDWCAPFEGPALAVNMGGYKCPKEVSDTGFFYNAAMTMVKLAKIFENAEDEAYYTDLAGKIRAVFREKFYDKANSLVKGDCQTATATMLFFGLYDDDEEKAGLLNKLIEQIAAKDYHVDFGVLGCKFVMHTLGKEGYGDVGTTMLEQKTFPGIAEWISRGATTLWECWNGEGSHNHHMFSDLSSYMYKYVAGISPDEAEPGFKHIIFRPAIDSSLEYASAIHESMHGQVVCDWKKENGKVSVKLAVPFGTHGTLYVPERFAEFMIVNGEAVAATVENGKAVIELVSGEYEVEMK